MNADELKLITDTIQALGQNGQVAFVWWLVMDKLLPVLGWLATLWGILRYLVTPLTLTAKCYGDISNFRDVLGIGRPGALSPSEHYQTIKKLTELVNGATK